MVGSEALAAGVLDASGAAAALALSDAAGWNQTAADWALFAAHGRLASRRTDDGQLVATAAALPYGAAQGWISMVLVRADWQKRGLATELLGECMDHLRALRITPLLDATPAGEPVYRRLGFYRGLAFARWQATLPHGLGQPGQGAVAPRAAFASDWPALLALDAAANGVSRAFLLEALLARPDSRAWVDAAERGFVLLRSGRRATQIGPLVAADDASAIGLLDAALATVSGAVFLDLLAPRRARAEHLQGLGFTQQRPFVRMALGDAPALHPHDGQYLLAGPEFG